MLPQSKNVRLTGSNSIYRAEEAVGKSCGQVGRSSTGEISASDSEVYDKWSQALSSADDLTYLACTDGRERTKDLAMAFVVPLVVVPDGRLWTAHYDANGNRTQDPQPANRCPFFVGRSYFHRSGIAGDELTLSHLEFVTLAGLRGFVNDLCGGEANLKKVFPADVIVERVTGAKTND